MNLNTKIYGFLQLLLASTAFANQCPKLSGSYVCVYPDQSMTQLKIGQTESAEITTYSFLYPEISSHSELVQASDQGIQDQMGWLVYCKSNKLIAVTLNGDFRTESFIDVNGNYVSHDIGIRVVHCFSSEY